MFYILIVLILTIIDQISKGYMLAISKGEIGYSIPVIKDFFHLTYVENHGGIFGLFQGKINIFTIISILLIIYIVKLEFKNWKNYTKGTKIAVSIISAGALGNMIDRLFRGYVIDMIDFNGIWKYIFNVADMYVHIGIYIICIEYLIKSTRKEK